jgi:hypothetical protein
MRRQQGELMTKIVTPREKMIADAKKHGFNTEHLR